MLRSADTGNYVFTLSVNEVFTVENIFTGSSVAAEAYTCSRSFTHVTEYHSHNRNSCTPFVWNSFHLTIKDSAFVHPAAEYCTNGAPKLFHRIVWEIVTCLFFDGLLEACNEILQVFYRKVLVELNAASFLNLFDDCFEWVDVFLVYRLHAKNNVAIHLYETAIRVVNEVRIVGLLYHTFSHLVVKTEVEDSIHHTRHRSACS